MRVLDSPLRPLGWGEGWRSSVIALGARKRPSLLLCRGRLGRGAADCPRCPGRLLEKQISCMHSGRLNRAADHRPRISGDLGVGVQIAIIAFPVAAPLLPQGRET